MDDSCPDLLALLIDEIAGYTATVQCSADAIEHEADGNITSHVRDLLAATQRLKRAADGAHELSSIRRGRIELARESFSPSQLVRTVVADIGSDQSAADVEFGLRVDTDVPQRVAGDQKRLRTVLEELIGLAVPSAGDGRVDIEVSTKPDGRIRFRVDSTKDHRPAGSPLLDAVMPWSQATGRQIGLALARHLIELMDGSLGYETNESGTSFWFDASLSPSRRLEDRRLIVSEPGQSADTTSPAHTPRQTLSDAAPATASIPRTPACQLHVLVVDDSDVNRLLATSQLERLGHTHETARSGLAALDLMTTGEFDAVLMDWHMPGMNGLEATRRWRDQHDPAHRLPIITMTASAMAGDRERCLDAGASDYLSKPVSINDLGSMLMRWCDERAPGSAGPPEEPVSPSSKIDELIADLGDPIVVRSIVEAFLDMVPQYRAAATAALASGDRQSIRRHAHTLKSTAVMLGTDDLAHACMALEAAATDQTAELDDAVAEFSRCCREAELTLIDLSTSLVSRERSTS